MHGTVQELLKGKQLKNLLAVSKDIAHEETIGYNSFHALAVVGLLAELPAQFVTLKNFLTKNAEKQTVFHLACPAHIPKAWQTEDNMLRQDVKGDTPLTTAVLSGWLEHFPKNLLTPKNLALMNNDGISAIDEAYQNKVLNQIPGLQLENIIQMSQEQRQEWVKVLSTRRWDARQYLAPFKQDFSHIKGPGAWSEI